MLFHGKTILLQNIPNLCYTLNNNFIIKQPVCLYGDKIAMNHTKTDKMNFIRIWRTKSLLDFWYDTESSGRSFIGALDYTVDKDSIKIDYIAVNDEDNKCYNENKISNTESKELLSSMVEYVKKIAQQEQKSKIKLDVHENLCLYNSKFKDLGFVLTDRRSKDNKYWIETIKSVE